MALGSQLDLYLKSLQEKSERVEEVESVQVDRKPDRRLSLIGYLHTASNCIHTYVSKSAESVCSTVIYSFVHEVQHCTFLMSSSTSLLLLVDTPWTKYGFSLLLILSCIPSLMSSLRCQVACAVICIYYFLALSLAACLSYRTTRLSHRLGPLQTHLKTLLTILERLQTVCLGGAVTTHSFPFLTAHGCAFIPEYSSDSYKGYRSRIRHARDDVTAVLESIKKVLSVSISASSSSSMLSFLRLQQQTEIHHLQSYRHLREHVDVVVTAVDSLLTSEMKSAISFENVCPSDQSLSTSIPYLVTVATRLQSFFKFVSSLSLIIDSSDRLILTILCDFGR
jgi:hypothetical protein